MTGLRPIGEIVAELLPKIIHRYELAPAAEVREPPARSPEKPFPQAAHCHHFGTPNLGSKSKERKMSRVKEELSNAIVPATEGNTALATEIADPYAAAIAAMDETLPLIKCDKNGVWWAGGNEVTCRAVIAMPTVCHGNHRWSSGDLIDQVVVPMTEPMPRREDLEDSDSKEWGEMRSVELRLLDTTDEEYLFSGSSNGIRKAVNSLVKKWRNRSASGAAVLPVVEFACREYQHNEYGTIHEPVFKIVAWMTEDQLFAEVYGDHQAITAAPSGQGQVGQVGDAVADDLDDQIAF